MRTEQRGNESNDSSKELVGKKLHTEITAVVRAHILEPRAGGRAHAFLKFQPTITAVLSIENGNKIIVITGTNYPWSNSYYSSKHNPYTIEDSSSEQRFIISDTKVITDIDPKGKDSQKNSEDVKKILSEVTGPNVKITGEINIKNPSKLIYHAWTDKDGSIRADIPRLKLIRQRN